MKNYDEILNYAKQLYKQVYHYDWSCDPEEYLIDLQTDIEIILEEKFGENDYRDIAGEAIYGC